MTDQVATGDEPGPDREGEAARDPGGSPALTARGARTRARLASAARELFEEHGYLATGVNEISAAAGVAYGTFYIYFSSKEEVFGEVVRDLHLEVRAIAAAEPHRGSDPASLIERANRGFFRAYQRTARMQRVVEQAATVNPRQALERREANRYWRERARRAITEWQIDGKVPRNIDAVYAANALGAMVDRFAYLWFVLGEDHDFETAVHQVTHLYCRALGIDHELEVAPGLA
jgi:AcrR family transcriptional regulator